MDNIQDDTPIYLNELYICDAHNVYIQNKKTKEQFIIIRVESHSSDVYYINRKYYTGVSNSTLCSEYEGINGEQIILNSPREVIKTITQYFYFNEKLDIWAAIPNNIEDILDIDNGKTTEIKFKRLDTEYNSVNQLSD